MARLYNKDKDQLYKRLTIKVFSPDNEQHKRFIQTAPSGLGFSESNITDLLEETARNIEAQFPEFEYNVVMLKPNVFNFVSRGRRNAEA